MKTSYFKLGVLSLLMSLTLSCGKEGFDVKENAYEPAEYALISQHLKLPESPLDYTVKFPDYYTASLFGAHRKNMATLGRVLFYDKAISKDGKVSCASCHNQAHAFSDTKALSDGVEGQHTARNSIALGSVFSFSEYYGAVFMGRVPFLWDNRADSAEDQARLSLTNSREMGMQMHEVSTRVRERPFYRPLFRVAFGDDHISDDRVLQAIGAFVNSLASVNSRFDKALDDHVKKGGSVENLSAPFAQFSAAENLGKQLYVSACASCHGQVMGAPALTAANNGLYLSYEDPGVGGLTQDPRDMGTFKVPTLRNVALSAPYMHDGSLPTLEAVVAHYSTGIQPHANLSPALSLGQGVPRRFNFTQEQQAALVAFLHTLTDHQYLTAEKYANPFK